MKSGFMSLDNADGIKIVINFFLGMVAVTFVESITNMGLPTCFADLMVIIKGAIAVALASTGRRFFTNSQGQFATTEATKDAPVQP